MTSSISHPAARLGRNTLAATLLALGLNGAGSLTAGAAEGPMNSNVYPGAGCERYSGSTLGRVGSMGHYYNDSNSAWVHVICPAMNDFSSGSIHGGTMRVADRNDDDIDNAVKCRLLRHRRSAGSWVGDWSALKSSYNGDPTLMNYPAMSDSPASHHYYRCSIPPRDADTGAASFITNYTVRELE